MKFLNVDPPWAPLESCSDLEREWAHERTYYRWAESGSLYGFSYHSGVLLAPGNPKSRLSLHFSDMYFDMVILLFYLRVSCFRFSRELGAISESLSFSGTFDISHKRPCPRGYEDIFSSLVV